MSMRIMRGGPFHGEIRDRGRGGKKMRIHAWFSGTFAIHHYHDLGETVETPRGIMRIHELVDTEVKDDVCAVA